MHAMKSDTMHRMALLAALSLGSGLAFAADTPPAKAGTPGAEIGNGSPVRGGGAPTADCTTGDCAPATETTQVATTRAADPLPDLALRALLGMEADTPEC